MPSKGKFHFGASNVLYRVTIQVVPNIPLTKVPFYYEAHVLKRNLCFEVNGRFCFAQPDVSPCNYFELNFKYRNVLLSIRKHIEGAFFIFITIPLGFFPAKILVPNLGTIVALELDDFNVGVS